MSLLTEFTTTVGTLAAAIIGEEPVTIGGGTAVMAVLNEVADSRQFVDIGMDPSVGLTAIIRKAAWAAAGYSSPGSQYVGKLAVTRSLSFRVESVKIGVSFVELALADKEKA